MGQRRLLFLAAIASLGISLVGTPASACLGWITRYWGCYSPWPGKIGDLANAQAFFPSLEVGPGGLVRLPVRVSRWETENYDVGLDHQSRDDEADWHVRILFDDALAARWLGVSDLRKKTGIPEPFTVEWMVLDHYEKSASHDEFYAIDLLDFLGVSAPSASIQQQWDLAPINENVQWKSSLVGGVAWIQGYLVNDEQHSPKPEIHPLLSLAYRNGGLETDESTANAGKPVVDVWRIGFFQNSTLHNVCNDQDIDFCGQQQIAWKLPLPGNLPLRKEETVRVGWANERWWASDEAHRIQNEGPVLLPGKLGDDSWSFTTKMPAATKLGAALVQTWVAVRGRRYVRIGCQMPGAPAPKHEEGFPEPPLCWEKKGLVNPKYGTPCAVVPTPEGAKKAKDCVNRYQIKMAVIDEVLAPEPKSVKYVWSIDGKEYKGDRLLSAMVDIDPLLASQESLKAQNAPWDFLGHYKVVVGLRIETEEQPGYPALPIAPVRLEIQLPKPEVLTTAWLSDVVYLPESPAGAAKLLYNLRVRSKTKNMMPSVSFVWRISGLPESISTAKSDGMQTEFLFGPTPSGKHVVTTVARETFGPEWSWNQMQVSVPRYSVLAQLSFLSGGVLGTWLPLGLSSLPAVPGGTRKITKYPRDWLVDARSVFGTNDAAVLGPVCAANKAGAVDAESNVAVGSSKLWSVLSNAFAKGAFCPTQFTLSETDGQIVQSISATDSHRFKIRLKNLLAPSKCANLRLTAKSQFGFKGETSLRLCPLAGALASAFSPKDKSNVAKEIASLVKNGEAAAGRKSLDAQGAIADIASGLREYGRFIGGRAPKTDAVKWTSDLLSRLGLSRAALETAASRLGKSIGREITEKLDTLVPLLRGGR